MKHISIDSLGGGNYHVFYKSNSNLDTINTEIQKQKIHKFTEKGQKLKKKWQTDTPIDPSFFVQSQVQYLQQ